MPRSNPARVQKPWSEAHIASFTGWNTKRLMALVPLMKWDWYYYSDDFDQTLDANRWTTGADAGATAFAVNASEDGFLRGQTGATDNNAISLRGAGGVMFAAARNSGLALRMKVDVVTSLWIEVGFTDALTDYTLPAVTDNDAAPPTTGNGATDLVVAHIDADQAVTSFRLVGDGTTDAASGATIDPAFTPTAAEYFEIVLLARANGGNVSVWSDQALVGSAAIATGPDGATLMQPWIFCGTRVAGNRIYDLDWIALWKERLKSA